MRSTFSTYLEVGFKHISDLQGYDHILFIVALCAIYTLKEWKKVALLATAFTIGHSITLALAALDIIPIKKDLVEFLIPVTIILTALYNVIFHKMDDTEVVGEVFNKRLNINYFFALIVGLIHGMGFSSFFKSASQPTGGNKFFNSSAPVEANNEFIWQLLSFNLGVELGQLIIVAIILLVSFLMLNILKVKQREWNLFVSGAAAGIALILALERWPF